MKSIDIDELDITDRFFSRGCFSNVHLVQYNNYQYCFKEFKFMRQYPKCIIENLSSLTEVDFDKEFFTPKMMVTYKDHCIGYLTLYNPYNNELYNSELNFEQKIEVLKSTRKLIEKLHSEYQIIHGDINARNILFDDYLNASLIDFDSAIKFEQQLESKITISYVLDDYIDHFGYDYKADIYRFNLTTLTVLNNLRTDEDLIVSILDESIQGSKKVKKLSKELIIRANDKRTSYSPEYIIDYF